MIREELSAQATRDLCAPTDWSVVEAPPKPRKPTKKQIQMGILPPPITGGTHKAGPPGIVNRAHMHMLAACVKLRKGFSYDVFLRKMISEEAAVVEFHVWAAIEASPMLIAALRELIPPEARGVYRHASVRGYPPPSPLGLKAHRSKQRPGL